MRLVELFLNETTEEDRALISLADSLYKHLQKFADQDLDYDNDEETLPVGKIGQLFDTPLQGFDNIKIEIQSDIGLLERINDKRALEGKKPIFEAPAGVWYSGINTIVFNADYLSSDFMKSTVTHELRHALDDLKSEYRVSSSSKYSTPKKKSFRKVTNDPHMGNLAYLAQPAEINARFTQVLDDLVGKIKRVAQLPFGEARDKLHRQLKFGFDKHNISHLFPEKEKSRDYKRLMKRAADFIDKELQHVQSSQPK
jgi:hypothetical protein